MAQSVPYSTQSVTPTLTSSPNPFSSPSPSPSIFPSTDASTSTPIDCHLVVLIHGLWGFTSHLDYIESSIQNSTSLNSPLSENLVVYKAVSNEEYKTYDGIDLCGTRVAQEILRETERLTHSGYKVSKFSCIGYSLGGLIGRYSVGVLYMKNYFNDIIPMNFTTFCTPHGAVLTPGNSISVKLFNYGASTLLGATGKQLFLQDNSSQMGTQSIPLLTLMTMPNTVFYKSLQSFKKLSLYSNIRSDIRTSWWCSGISNVNPFEILDKNPNVKIDDRGLIHFENGSTFELNFLDNYGPTVLDVNKPIKFTGLIDYSASTKNDSKEQDLSGGGSGLDQMIFEDLPDDNIASQDVNQQSNITSKFFNFVTRKLKWVTLLLKSTVYIPVYLFYLIMKNLLQTFTSGIRVLKESSQIKEFLETYNIEEPVVASSRPTLSKKVSETYIEEMDKFEQELHAQGDSIFESLFDALLSSENPNSSIFDQSSMGASSGDETLITTVNKLCNFPIDDIHDKNIDVLKQTAFFKNTRPEDILKYYQILKNFKLGLSKEQRKIIQNLNTLNWEKYPVYITKTNMTHAAAVVRFENSDFEEGKVVVRHYVNEVFVN